jgi:hypothetical protein
MKAKVKTNQSIKCVDQKEHAQENKYNGWANYETWNISLWINNNERLYDIAKDCKDYAEFIAFTKDIDITMTGDKVKYDNELVNVDEINEMLKELRGE